MYSDFYTPKKVYLLKTSKYICNRFGLTECLVANIEKLNYRRKTKSLDVGCGAGPISIFLADQKENEVVGVEIVLDAYICALENIKSCGLENKITIIHQNFMEFCRAYSGENFDYIVANPPIDENVPDELIQKYADFNGRVQNNESFSYFVNSWHSPDGKDLLDYIFSFGIENLKENGSIVIVFCTIDCKSPLYVIEKGEKYGFIPRKMIETTILPESIGVSSLHLDEINTYIMELVRI